MGRSPHFCFFRHSLELSLVRSFFSMNPESPPKVSVRDEREITKLVISGDWTTRNLAEPPEISTDSSSSHLEVDCSELGRIDSVGALAILSIAPEVTESEGLPENVARLFELVDDARQATDVPEVDRYPFHVRLGETVYQTWESIRTSARFLGKLEVSLARSIIRPSRIRPVAFASSIWKAGLEALPLIAIMTFFIGAVVALIGSDLLEMLGASELVVELVGISVLREFGVLIPAILLAGRSASTFAAQIGAMRMNQETEAMQVLGIDLFDALVLPRFLALLVTMPLLAVIAMMAGLAGGVIVSWGVLDVSPVLFIERLKGAVDIRHFWVGMAKVPVLAAVIAIAGCRHGLAVEGDVEELGSRVTLAVVQALFAIIFFDAAFAVLFNVLGV